MNTKMALTDLSLRKEAIIALIFFMFGWASHTIYTAAAEHLMPNAIKSIQKSGELKVVLLNSPSTYYIASDGNRGFEYDLLNEYAKHLGVKLNIIQANTVSEALKLSQENGIVITSAAISKTKAREEKFTFGPAYFETQGEVVCSRNMPSPKSFPKYIEALSGLNLLIASDTSHAQTIKELQEDGYEINATYSSDLASDELLAKVAKKEIDCTVVDSNVYAINQRYYPEIAPAFNIGKRTQLAWIIQKDTPELKEDLFVWLNNFSQSGKLANLKDHYYNNSLFFDYYDTTTFYDRIKSRLPHYKNHFETYAAKYDIPSSLLAAQAYQESQWNPKARSYTGVTGMMMLTQETAQRLGVKNIHDPKQSIAAGAKYLDMLEKKVPKGVSGEDRMKYALVAYNLGVGHMHDAMRLAKEMRLNPNIWSDLKQALPLLGEKRYYKTLKHGFARGEEALKYVESIYDYKNIIENCNDAACSVKVLER